MKTHHPTIPYRADIDGLRAVAVLPVLFFHAALGFPGGYVGVDVFFVISGYLIGSLVIKEIEAGTFSMVNFWERRIRRIFPALSVVVMACLVAGYFWFIPQHFEELGQSAIAQPLLCANFYFWRQTGYFETVSEFQPLLHTWSLAVEEQFYVLFPPLLLLALRWGKSFAIKGVIAFIVISLALSVYLTAAYPSFSFFLIASRVWELDLGVLLAILPARKFLAPLWNELMAWLGLGLILWAVFFYSSSTPFPGVAALAPCLGTALLINFNTGTPTSIGRLLSLKPVVYIGKISYSLYLWHWPLIVFVKYLSMSEVTQTKLVVTLLASFILAVLSWKYVETPFRKKSIFGTRKQIFAFGAVVGGFFVIVGTIMYKTDGYPSRFPPEVVKHQKNDSRFIHTTQLDCLLKGESLPTVGAPVSETGPPATLIWGDSHATVLLPAVDTIAREANRSVYVAAKPGTVPIAGVYFNEEGKGGTDYGTPVLQFIKDKGIKHVIMVARWEGYAFIVPGGDLRRLIGDEQTFPHSPEHAQQVFIRKLRKTVATLLDSGVTVSLFQDVGLQPRDVPSTVAQAASRGLDLNTFALPIEHHREYSKRVNDLIDEAIRGLDVKVIDPLPYFTNSEGIYLMAKDGQTVYNDRDHVSPFGSLLLRPELEPLIK
ncbi:MAG: acyltransferase family protein [Verrucomicrobiales bacterium]|nr:acyltransferase family protein [Verrucomicrobiales bacterium]